MSCERYAAAIVDRACGAEIAPDTQRHLDGCDRCRARLDEQRQMMQGLDDELRQALAIAPSPFFDRAVRARVAQSPSVWPQPIGRTALAAVAMAAIAVAIGVMRPTKETGKRVEETTRIAPSTAASPAIVRSRSTEAALPLDGTRAEPAAADRLSTRAQLSKSHVGALPSAPVIVPAEQSQAVDRYLLLVRSGRLDTSSLATLAEPGEPPPLVISPLSVKPLSVPAVDLGTGPGSDRSGRD